MQPLCPVFLVVIFLIAPSEQCMKTISPEPGIPETTLPPMTTLDYCTSCEYADLTTLPTEADSELPSQTKESVDADGCMNMYMRCYRTQNTVCLAVNLYGVTATSTVEIGSGDTVQADGTIVCDKKGEWTYNGEVITRVFCTFADCL